MGVAGLWDILRPAGQLRSLTHLSVKEGFEDNPDGKRGFRVGIDASIWFYHAAYGKEGENPELRTLFFRCARLMSMPFLPLFVFDGPKRPDIKRGKRITGKNHWMVQGMQEIITAFGFEWRMAPGEAEAELAYLNRIGVIDAVLSDDVDTFLFGAKTVIRNKNATLSGNKAHSMKNSAGKDDGNHAMVYRSADILNREDIQLTQGGLILIGILRGGDYCQEGLDGCGVALAHGLAKCGFGDTLLTAARTKSREELEEFLDGWRDEIRAELRTNARGHLPRKSPKLSRSVSDDFPRVDVVLAYTTPVTSEAKGRAHKNAVVDWDKEPDLGKIAALCEMYFEWGLKDIIIKRFRNVLWPSAVLRILRRAAILKDRRAARLTGVGGGVPVTPRKNGKERRAPPGTPSSMIARHFSTMRLESPHASRAAALAEDDDDEEDESPLIVKIHSSRQHPSTDKILEYRLEVAPAQLVRLCEVGLKGLRTALPPDLTDSEDDEGDSDDDEGGGKKGKKKTKKPPADPDSHLRIWLPACMVEMVEPEMVDEFEGVQRMKADKKAGQGAAKKGTAYRAAASAGAAAKRGKKASATAAIMEEEEESSGESSGAESSRPKPPPKPKAPLPAKKTSIPVAKDAGSSDKAMDQFFMTVTKKPTADAPAKSAKATVNTAARVADLFKDIPASPRRKAPISAFLDTSDDEVPRPPPLSRLPARAATTSSTKSSSPSKGPSRILSLFDTASHASKAAPPRAGPSNPKAAVSAPALIPDSASASTSSPTKPRALRPFPMELDFFNEDSPQPSPVDEDLFTTDRISSGSGSGSGYGFGSGSRSSSARTRSRSAVSSDSDSRGSALQKSPRRSEKHASPRDSPSKVKQTAFVARREEEEEDSEDDRPPSPSPMKGRSMPNALSGPAGTSAGRRREEEEEESDRAPSPSPARRRVLPPLNKPAMPLIGARKHTPLPADLSIISIPSDSEDELPPPPLPRKVAPLQQARARLTKTASAPNPRTATSSTATTSSSTRTSRKAPQRIYDSGDIIDLT